MTLPPDPTPGAGEDALHLKTNHIDSNIAPQFESQVPKGNIVLSLLILNTILLLVILGLLIVGLNQ